MTTPAGFWRRTAAWTLDAALIAILAAPVLATRLADAARTLDARFSDLLVVFYGSLSQRMDASLPMLAVLDDPALEHSMADTQDALYALLGPCVFALVVLGLVLHVAGERSAWQGSPGMRALRLRAVDRDGAGIGLARAVGRHFAGTLSWLTLNLGHLMAAVPPAHLALHDRVSGTRVIVEADAGPMPTWARAWLALQAFTAAAATVALAGHLMQLAQAAAERAFGG